MSKEETGTSRREFIKRTAATATGLAVGLSSMNAAVFASAKGANDKIRVGFIGIGNRGTQFLERFMGNRDVEVAALCDVYQPYTTRDRSQVNSAGGQAKPRAWARNSAGITRCNDFRELLDMKDMDAVCIATPDHWHAMQTIQAIQAGKDVYVEKPADHLPQGGASHGGGRKKSNQVVAVGLNRRGSSVYQKLAREVQGGKIGQVATARAYRISNMFPQGIGTLQEDTAAGF